MSEVKDVAEVLEVIDSTKEEVISWNTMSDTQLMNELSSRDMQIPMDNGKLVRLVAIKMLRAYEESSKPLSSYRKMRVIFHRSGREGEAPYVFVGLNGRSIQIPYEIEVVVPEPIIRTCVDNAIITEYALGEFNMSTGTVDIKEKTIRAVPYTFLGYED